MIDPGRIQPPMEAFSHFAERSCLSRMGRFSRMGRNDSSGPNVRRMVPLRSGDRRSEDETGQIGRLQQELERAVALPRRLDQFLDVHRQHRKLEKLPGFAARPVARQRPQDAPLFGRKNRNAESRAKSSKAPNMLAPFPHEHPHQIIRHGSASLSACSIFLGGPIDAMT